MGATYTCLSFQMILRWTASLYSRVGSGLQRGMLERRRTRMVVRIGGKLAEGLGC